MWWDHFKSMQRGRAVTWEDFKQAFKSHHIPKGLMDRKMRELLALGLGIKPNTRTPNPKYPDPNPNNPNP
jgi:hypothetical protein